MVVRPICLGVRGVLGAGHDEVALLLQLAHELEPDALVGAEVGESIGSVENESRDCWRGRWRANACVRTYAPGDEGDARLGGGGDGRGGHDCCWCCLKEEKLESFGFGCVYCLIEMCDGLDEIVGAAFDAKSAGEPRSLSAACDCCACFLGCTAERGQHTNLASFFSRRKT